jgi:hypothetical protein
VNTRHPARAPAPSAFAPPRSRTPQPLPVDRPPTFFCALCVLCGSFLCGSFGTHGAPKRKPTQILAVNSPRAATTLSSSRSADGSQVSFPARESIDAACCRRGVRRSTNAKTACGPSTRPPSRAWRNAKAADARGIRRSVQCGVPEHGSTRRRCKRCGHEMLVARIRLAFERGPEPRAQACLRGPTHTSFGAG